MNNDFAELINTRLRPGFAVAAGGDRGGLVDAKSRTAGVTDPGYNAAAIRKWFLPFLFLLTVCLHAASNFAAQADDAEYDAVAEEYIKTYLAAHPLEGTGLGLHEYDGKISDYSRLALDAELSRLRRFDDRLAKFDPSKLSARQSIDLRILQTAVKKDLRAKSHGLCGRR